MKGVSGKKTLDLSTTPKRGEGKELRGETADVSHAKSSKKRKRSDMKGEESHDKELE
jgi:hypothetical protein